MLNVALGPKKNQRATRERVSERERERQRETERGEGEEEGEGEGRDPQATRGHELGEVRSSL